MWARSVTGQAREPEIQKSRHIGAGASRSCLFGGLCVVYELERAKLSISINGKIEDF
jgi:hypothetical protein